MMILGEWSYLEYLFQAFEERDKVLLANISDQGSDGAG